MSDKEPTTRRGIARAAGVSLMIAHLIADRFTGTAPDFMSEHFRPELPPEPAFREMVIDEQVEVRDGRMILKVYPTS